MLVELFFGSFVPVEEYCRRSWGGGRCRSEIPEEHLQSTTLSLMSTAVIEANE